MPHETDLLSSIGLSVTAAAVLGYAGHRLRQPLILAYLMAGLVIGPEVGFGWVSDRGSIQTVSEIGLILLLFIIGLEIDLKKLIAAGKPVVVTGTFQFLLCVALGWAVFAGCGYRAGGEFAVPYLAVCLSLSSTMIVVKLLYDKFELDTLPGRITLGVLVFQDIWAIIALAIQPSLLNPQMGPLLASLGKGALLVALSLVVSRHVLPAIFRSVAKSPEMVLVASLAWCFSVCSAANYAGLSREMGALIAGASISTFPYNLDVVAKVASIRDFFVTLFFVALGMQIPMPTREVVVIALAASLFLIASRFVVVFPILHLLRKGHRVSLLTAINLSQISEFSMVIASIGLSYKHIDSTIVSVLIFVFAFTSTASTYLIGYSHPLYERLSRFLKGIGVRDLDESGSAEESQQKHPDKRIAFLGFFREASSLLHEFELQETAEGKHPLLDETLVIDFNPDVHAELNRRGISCVYGDIAHMDTLLHGHIQKADIILSTIPDAILKGTNNMRLLQQSRRLCPAGKVIVTADRIPHALDLYEAGADYVFIPRLHSVRQLVEVIERGRRTGLEALREEQIRELRRRREVLE